MMQQYINIAIYTSRSLLILQTEIVQGGRGCKRFLSTEQYLHMLVKAIQAVLGRRREDPSRKGWVEIEN